jgi:hypothetical protein
VTITVGDDHRAAGAHRFEDRARRAFAIRRQDQDVRGGEHGADVGNVAEVLDRAVGDPAVELGAADARRVGIDPTGGGERGVGANRAHAARHLDELDDAFLAHQPADVDEARRARWERPGRIVIDVDAAAAHERHRKAAR